MAPVKNETIPIASGSGAATGSSLSLGWVLLAMLLLAAAGWGAYHNSFHVPFVFDDHIAIEDNAHLRRLWPLWYPLNTPQNAPIAGRPMASLSLALNYAVSGQNVWSYHVFNLVLHVLSAVLLFGIARRTLRSKPLLERFGQAATPLALTIALLWLVHPLQTEAVTYIVQRTELLMGLFYLLTLYLALRGFASSRPGRWLAASVLACGLGMGSKEVMASAPLLVLLYDRTFVTGSFKDSLRLRRGFYAALAGTWTILATLLLFEPRSASVGFGLRNISALDYARTQCQVILHYLRLSLWPDPLVVDYGWPVVRSFSACFWQGMTILGLLLGSAWALRFRPVLGFVGVWFFAILAPSSSFVPIVTELAAERRMYLSLAAVVALVVIGGFAGWQTLIKRCIVPPRLTWPLGLALVGGVAGGFVALSAERNKDYQSEYQLWRATVAKAPYSARAHNNLGEALVRLNRGDEAREQFEQTVALQPDFAEGQYNLGCILAAQGQIDRAVEQFRLALKANWVFPLAHNNLAAVLMRQGRFIEAAEHLEIALRYLPDYPTAEYNMGLALASQGKSEEALEHFDQATRLMPDYLAAHRESAWQRATHEFHRADAPAKAIASAQRACELASPNDSQCLDVLAAAYAAAGRYPEAVATARRALESAATAGKTRQTREIQQRLELYQAGRPYRTQALGN